MKLVSIYKLENRIIYLENRLHYRKVYEAEETKGDLFSSNIEDVKLAVESGEDINKLNKFNVSALTAAISSKDDRSNIVKYLLDNGAIINNSPYSDSPDLFIAIRRANTKNISYLVESGADIEQIHNFDPSFAFAVSLRLDVDTIKKLIPSRFTNFDLFFKFIDSLLEYAILKKQRYIELYNCITKDINSEFVNILASEYANKFIYEEYRCLNESPTLDLFSQYKIMPAVRLSKSFDSKMHSMYNSLFEFSKAAISNNYKLPSFKYNKYNYIDFLKLVFDLGEFLSKDTQFIFELVTPELMKYICNKEAYYTNNDEMSYLLTYCATNNRLDLLNAIYNINEINPFLMDALYKTLSNNISRDATKLIASIIYKNKDLDSSTTYNVDSLISKESKNKHAGLILKLLTNLGYIDYILNLNPNNLSDSMRDYLENDFQYDNSYSNEDIAKILSAISDDTMNRELSKFINDNQAILLDDRIEKSIENNLSNSLTARQLKKKSDDYKTKNKPAYDF